MNSMGYGIVNRMSKVVVMALVVSALGLALVSTGKAHAQDNETEPGSLLCSPFGTNNPPSIPEGTVIKANGSYWQCVRGYWSKRSSGPVNPGGSATLSPDATTSGGGKLQVGGAAHIGTLSEAR
jgi:hypothetical protein